MPLPLVPGESRLYEATGGKLTVWITNRRVIAKESTMGASSATSLPLEKIDSMQQVYTSRPFFLILGAFLGFIGFMMVIVAGTSDEDLGPVVGFGVFLIFIGIGCVIVWLLTRKERVVVRTQQSFIDLEAGGIGLGVIEQFLTAAEAARQERIAELSSPQTIPVEIAQAQASTPPRVELTE